MLIVMEIMWDDTRELRSHLPRASEGNSPSLIGASELLLAGEEVRASSTYVPDDPDLSLAVILATDTRLVVVAVPDFGTPSGRAEVSNAVAMTLPLDGVSITLGTPLRFWQPGGRAFGFSPDHIVVTVAGQQFRLPGDDRAVALVQHLLSAKH